VAAHLLVHRDPAGHGGRLTCASCPRTATAVTVEATDRDVRLEIQPYLDASKNCAQRFRVAREQAQAKQAAARKATRDDIEGRFEQVRHWLPPPFARPAGSRTGTRAG
jgi:hypothetical protein